MRISRFAGLLLRYHIADMSLGKSTLSCKNLLDSSAYLPEGDAAFFIYLRA